MHGLHAGDGGHRLPTQSMDAKQRIFLRDAHLVPLAAQVLDCIIHLNRPCDSKMAPEHS